MAAIVFAVSSPFLCFCGTAALGCSLMFLCCLFCFLAVSSPVEQENDKDKAKNSRGRLYHNGKEPASTCHP
jgi:hypothetical protein